MKLAILSDTHGLLRPEVMERLKDAGAILHGGDINRQSILDQLEEYAPLYVVRGNNDKEWAEQLPHDRTVTLEGVTFFLVHNRKEVPAELSGVDVVVFGHSHRYVQEERDGVLWLNPGSCGLPLDYQPGAPSTLLRYESGRFQVEERRVPYDVEETIAAARNSPAYQQAAGWYQLNSWQLRTARDCNRVFFRFLQEQQRRSSPQTDQEHNLVFHKALALAQAACQQRKPAGDLPRTT